ncbi:hypothetical protein AAY42_10065 [Flagellimonas eckloniae]|uniref:Uncharacterized protein n=2 Tax=Flagellimonas eckloniae TaxID=346185 RepID=A0A0Q0XLB4_9FLAO|nr:hypothetical protein AAY42_10065 [Allomuricauda eckloniae]
MAVALNEMAEKELIKHFRHKGTWLERVPSKNKWVNNDVIKLTEIGADPDVLINNNTYPIPISSRTDDSVAISLYKYDTENTRITDDEVYALPYDKAGSVQEQHRETLEEKTEEHALHSLAPSANTADTPIIETTGDDDGNGRLRLRSQDLINYKKTLDDLKIPKAGRILVLSSEHVADLLIEDKALERQYQNHTDGMIAKNYYGFEIYESNYSPVYDGSLNKIAFDSVTPGSSASVLFHTKTTGKARGSVKRYLAKSDDDPQNRETVVGFRLYFLAIPLRAKGQGAIVSGTP